MTWAQLAEQRAQTEEAQSWAGEATVGASEEDVVVTFLSERENSEKILHGDMNFAN
jgi:hypothetical protein